MLWVILASPLLAMLCIASIWIWWGIAFTIIDFVLHLSSLEDWAATQEEPTMIETIERARIIRFAPLAHAGKPALLSTFDAERNLLTIDPDNYQLLEGIWQTHVTFSELPETVVTSDGNFVAV